METPIISVVLGSYNRLSFLKLTIQSILSEMKNFPHEIIIVDGGSTDGTLDWLLKQKNIITIIQHNRGTISGKQIKRKPWGYFMNLAFKSAEGKYICMLSDDCLVIPGAIKNGYRLFEKKLKQNQSIGAIAFYFRNWSVQNKYHVGNPLGTKIYVNHGLYLKKALKDVGFIDEKIYSFYCADIDLCFKLCHKGYTCIPSEDSYIEHYPHANLQARKGNALLGKNDLIAFRKKWKPIFPEIGNHNVGIIKEKIFVDKTLTGDQFKNIHQKIPPVITPNSKPPNFAQKIYAFLSWKIKVQYRKIKKNI